MAPTKKTKEKASNHVPPTSKVSGDNARTSGDQAVTTGNGQPGLTIITPMLTDEQRREYRPIDWAMEEVYLKNAIEENKILYPKDEPVASKATPDGKEGIRRSKRLQPSSNDSDLIALPPTAKKGPKEKKKSSGFKTRADSFKRELRSSKKKASSPTLAEESKPKRGRPSTKT